MQSYINYFGLLLDYLSLAVLRQFWETRTRKRTKHEEKKLHLWHWHTASNIFLSAAQWLEDRQRRFKSWYCIYDQERDLFILWRWKQMLLHLHTDRLYLSA